MLFSITFPRIELLGMMKQFAIDRCVIDGIPETHATRAFAERNAGHLFLNFFNENQRGGLHCDLGARLVQVNRTEALDASRTAIRDKKLVLPRRSPLVEAFDRHMTADAKIPDEDEETGAKNYRNIRSGEDHLFLAFTDAWMAASDPSLASWLAFWIGVHQGKWPAVQWL